MLIQRVEPEGERARDGISTMTYFSSTWGHVAHSFEDSAVTAPAAASGVQYELFIAF